MKNKVKGKKITKLVKQDNFMGSYKTSMKELQSKMKMKKPPAGRNIKDSLMY
jgi:hypothetical protein